MAAVGTVACPRATAGGPVSASLWGSQERFQVKNPPSAYIQKLKSYLDTGGVSRKVRGPRCTPVPWSPCQAGHRHGANRCPCPTVQEASAGVHAGAPGAGDFPEDQLHRVRVGVASSPSCCHCLRGGNGRAAGSGWRVTAGCGGCGLILPSWRGSDGRQEGGGT